MAVPAGAITLSVEPEKGTPAHVAPQAHSTASFGSLKGIKEKTGTPREDAVKPRMKSGEARVRVGDEVGFYAFVSAGFAVGDPGVIHPIGRVVSGPDVSTEFAYPNQTYIEITDEREVVGPGDWLVVCRAKASLSADPVGMKGYQVENLAVIRVLEVQKKRCLVQVKDSFRIFHPGDWAVPYDRELRRWKKARTMKPLPDHPIRCYVLGSGAGKSDYEQTDTIFLSAGEKQGIVEGQTFQLRDYQGGNLLEEGSHVPVGTARVIYSGPEVSTARILRNNRPVHEGFEAEYRP